VIAVGYRRTVILNEEKMVNKPYRSPYVRYFYCTHCGLWIPKDKVNYDKNGNPICPICHQRLRTGPKKRRGEVGK